MLKFTKKERRSLLIFAWLIIGLLAVRYWLGHQDVPLAFLSAPSQSESADKKSNNSHKDQRAHSARTPRHQAAETTVGREEQLQTDSNLPSSGRAAELFDPNHASFEVMTAAGLPRRVVHTILNYREKGGRFYKKEDLLKIYVMTDSIYKLVEPWVDIPPPPEVPSRSKPRELIDINAADAEEWTYLPGIGKGYAGRICRFRKALRGFVSVEQVAETFGLPDTVFQRIRPLLTIHESIEGIQINAWTVEELASHPYIGAKEARILVNYRIQHGPYRDQVNIRTAKAFPDSNRLKRLESYWRFEE